MEVRLFGRGIYGGKLLNREGIMFSARNLMFIRSHSCSVIICRWSGDDRKLLAVAGDTVI